MASFATHNLNFKTLVLRNGKSLLSAEVFLNISLLFSFRRTLEDFTALKRHCHKKIGQNLEYNFDSIREAFGWKMARCTDAFGLHSFKTHYKDSERRLKASHKTRQVYLQNL